MLGGNIEMKIDWKWIKRYSEKEENGNKYFDKELGKAVLYLKEKLETKK